MFSSDQNVVGAGGASHKTGRVKIALMEICVAKSFERVKHSLVSNV